MPTADIEVINLSIDLNYSTFQLAGPTGRQRQEICVINVYATLQREMVKPYPVSSLTFPVFHQVLAFFCYDIEFRIASCIRYLVPNIAVLKQFFYLIIYVLSRPLDLSSDLCSPLVVLEKLENT